MDESIFVCLARKEKHDACCFFHSQLDSTFPVVEPQYKYRSTFLSCIKQSIDIFYYSEMFGQWAMGSAIYNIVLIQSVAAILIFLFFAGTEYLQ